MTEQREGLTAGGSCSADGRLQLCLCSLCLEVRNPAHPIRAAAVTRQDPFPGELKQTGMRSNEEQNAFREISSGATRKDSYAYFTIPSLVFSNLL